MKRSALENYLNKRALYPALLKTKPNKNLGILIAIPCYDEANVLQTLQSISNCSPPPCAVELILLINNAEIAPEAIQKRNQATYEEVLAAIPDLEHTSLNIYVFYFSNLPKKHAGVGLARKIAMDEAVRRFYAAENPMGIIACLDADTQVSSNYLNALYKAFAQDTACIATSIYYEHPLEGKEFDIAIYAAITRYELHLRYYVHALRQAGCPYATQTVGSSMAVRARAYAAQGGMNRRKAGEDFYFIHKFTALEGFRELTTATVFPSPRISTRVPFGTGKAIGEMIEGQAFSTYSPAIFQDLAIFLERVSTFYLASDTELMNSLKALPSSVQTFLKQEDFSTKISEIQSNTSNEQAFTKRFFRWFDAFKAMKYIHFARDHFYPNLAVKDAVKKWLAQHPIWSKEQIDQTDEKALLLFFRKLDRTLSAVPNEFRVNG